jgi:hypothetical protein
MQAAEGLTFRQKDEAGSGDHAGKGRHVVPFDRVAEVKDGEHAEDGQRDDFLGDFELGGGRRCPNWPR